MIELNSVDEVIAVLGGVTAAAGMVGKTAQTANSWRVAQQLPTKTYLVLSKELEKRGYTAPLRLWGMIEPTRAESAA